MDFYKNTKAKNPYNSADDISEPDLRAELKKILYTEGRGSYFVYRRVRRDSEGYPILADSTLTNRSGESTYKTNKGMKYLFDDHIIVGYKSEGSTFHETGSIKTYGDSRTNKNTLFLEHDVLFKITDNLKDMPDTYDKIIEPEYDINGKLTSPLKVYLRYDIGSPEPYRLNGHGRVEFFKINLISNMDDSIQL